MNLAPTSPAGRSGEGKFDCAPALVDPRAQSNITSILSPIEVMVPRTTPIALVRDLALNYEPAAVVRRVHSSLMAFGFERFVTLIAAVLAADEDRLYYVNAGHPAGLLWNTRGRLERLPGTGPLVSPALPSSDWEQASVRLSVGDSVLLYTDGVSDALAGEQDVGEEQIVAAVGQGADVGGPLLDRILSLVHTFNAGRPQLDDLTLLAATRFR